MTNSEIIDFLTSKTINAGFIDKLKIKYRPIICPFNDLVDLAEGKTNAFDIGCGSGQFCALLLKFSGIQKVMGIEISETLVKNAYQVNDEFKASKAFNFETFDGKDIPEEIKEYDLVYMIDVFHHIPPAQQEAFMKQLHQKMKAGATLVFKDINAGSPMVVFNKLHDLVFSGEIGKEMSYKKGLDMLGGIGFKIRKSYKKPVFVYPHFFIICEK